MALVGFSHAGTPGSGTDGLGTHIRATMAGDSGFTTHWTVYSEVLLGAGTTERSYWVIEHTNGHQILMAVGNGADAGGDNLIHSSTRDSTFDTILDHTIWMVLDPNGGAAGSDSIYDNLYNNALDPGTSGFWNQTERSLAMRLNEWFEGGGAATLYFIYDTAAGHFIAVSYSGGTGRTNSIGGVVMSDTLLDDSRRAVDDRLPSRAGAIGFEPDSDSGGNDCIGFLSCWFPGGVQQQDEGEVSDLVNDFYQYSSWPTEPDTASNYKTQTIPVQLYRTAIEGRRVIVGEVDRSLMRFCPSALPLGKRRDTGALMSTTQEILVGWDNALGDIIP